MVDVVSTHHRGEQAEVASNGSATVFTFLASFFYINETIQESRLNGLFLACFGKTSPVTVRHGHSYYTR